MNLQKKHLFLGEAPAVLVFNESIEQAKNKGCILFYHGLSSSKDNQDKEFFSLAENGFLVAGIDNIGHGERRYKDFDRRFSHLNPNLEEDFINAVYSTAKEVPKVIDALNEKGLINLSKIGIIGISMGGYITYSAILKEPRIKVAVSILGSPKWKIEHSNSPHRHLKRLYPTAILSQNAGLDTSVRPEYAREFHEELNKYYTQAPERHKYFEYPNSGHFMKESDWNFCWQRTIEWFTHFL